MNKIQSCFWPQTETKLNDSSIKSRIIDLIIQKVYIQPSFKKNNFQTEKSQKNSLPAELCLVSITSRLFFPIQVGSLQPKTATPVTKLEVFEPRDQAEAQNFITYLNEVSIRWRKTMIPHHSHKNPEMVWE